MMTYNLTDDVLFRAFDFWFSSFTVTEHGIWIKLSYDERQILTKHYFSKFQTVLERVINMSDERDLGEKCMRCGRRYSLVWTAPDDLWLKIVGREGGLLCLDCFDRTCKDEGIYLRWVPAELD